MVSDKVFYASLFGTADIIIFVTLAGEPSLLSLT